MTSLVHVRAPCRLHFGMFGFGRADRPQFGGVGVMVEPPVIEVTIRPAAAFHVFGDLAERARRFATLATRAWSQQDMPACAIHVRSPDNHVGLGVGTQLALSVAAGLRHFLQLPDAPVEELAASVGRAQRSAVGTYGFRYGGLIVDAGLFPGATARGLAGRLAQRVALPDEWCFVLVCPADRRGLAGDSEADAFARLPPVPGEVTDELLRITHDEILPAVGRGDCCAFGEAVFRYGRLAAECFAAVQGGPFANSNIERLVGSVRNHGVTGVGQSSWGPTVFALCESESEAKELAERLRRYEGAENSTITIARPNNRGAIVKASS